MAQYTRIGFDRSAATPEHLSVDFRMSRGHGENVDQSSTSMYCRTRNDPMTTRGPVFIRLSLHKAIWTWYAGAGDSRPCWPSDGRREVALDRCLMQSSRE
jgi:hypothetical protein